MKRKISTFCYLTVLLYLSNNGTTQITPAQALNTKTPQVCDIQHISLNLHLNQEKKQVAGKATITLIMMEASGSLQLDACALNIESVKTPTGNIVDFEYKKGAKTDKLIVQLGKTYKQNESVELEIAYSSTYVNETAVNSLGGSNGKGLRFFTPGHTEPRRRKQVWASSEYLGNLYWFPASASLSDWWTSELIISVEEPLMVIANGVLQSKTKNKNGTNTFHWKTEEEHPFTHLMLIAGNYTDIRQQVNNVVIHHYAYPDEVAATHASVERFPDMMNYFGRLTGMPFPYKEYAQAFVQELPWGIAGASLALQTENMVDDYGTHADYFYLWDGLEAEALAWQWAGGVVVPQNYRHCWLSRGLAHYMDALYNEYKNGREEMLWWNHAYNWSLYAGDRANAADIPLVIPEDSLESTLVTGNTAYAKAALVFNMLREELGEEKWQKGLHLYFKKYYKKNVNTQQFQECMELASNSRLDWFFRQWVYHTGHPVFEVQEQYNPQKKQYVLQLKQVQEADSSYNNRGSKYFEGKMKIIMDGVSQVLNIRPQSLNSFIFNSNKKPGRVNIDPGNTWIKEMKRSCSLQELLTMLKLEEDIACRQWALNELSVLAKDSTTAIENKNRIRNALREVISSNAYWRLRISAMNQLTSLEGGTYSPETISVLKNIIYKEASWLRATAVNLLGKTRESAYIDLYVSLLNDPSDRVVNAAAIALGKTKTSGVYSWLEKLPEKPSWKNQSLISALNGIKEAGDMRGLSMAMNALMDTAAGARWTLATPVWDYRIAAAQTLAALGMGAKGYAVVEKKLKKALEENNLNDIFSNVLLLAELGDERATGLFKQLQQQYKTEQVCLEVLNQYGQRLLEVMKNGK